MYIRIKQWMSSGYWKTKKKNIINRDIAGVKAAVEVEAAPLRGAAVTLTNAVPQYRETASAALE
jgi:hypothetical protein